MTPGPLSTSCALLMQPRTEVVFAGSSSMSGAMLAGLARSGDTSTLILADTIRTRGRWGVIGF